MQIGNPPPLPGALPASAQVGVKRLLTSFEFWLALEILIFGVIVIIAEYLIMRSQKLNAEEALRLYGVTLIVIGTLFIICAGFGNDQIAPALGLFGTLAGYLLGRRASDKPAEGTRADSEKEVP
jgi:hypothetical protein